MTPGPSHSIHSRDVLPRPIPTASELGLLGGPVRRYTGLLPSPATHSRDSERGPVDSGAFTSRFITANEPIEVGVPVQGQPNNAGDRGGEIVRARAAEERHTALERAEAVRTVAGHAFDGADCEMLLAVLGLDPVDGLRPRR